MATQTKQTRTIVLIDGVEQFKLYIEVLDKGDLPSPNLFLVQIVDTTDPKEDTFARVVTLSDFDNYGIDRATAVDTGEEYYRTVDHTFYYDNLETAVNAQDVIKSRVDELVEDWVVYDTSFVTTPDETTDHPRVDEDQFNALVTAYNTAVTTEAAALVTRDAAKDDYDTAIVNAATAVDNLANAKERSEACTKAKAAYTFCLNLYTALYADANTFKGASTVFYNAAATFRSLCTGDPPTDPQKSTYDGAASVYNNAQNTFSAEMAQATKDLVVVGTGTNDVTALCNDLQAEWLAAQTAKETADQAVSTTRTVYEDEQTAYEATQAKTEAALVDVKALKPDWTPT